MSSQVAPSTVSPAFPFPGLAFKGRERTGQVVNTRTQRRAISQETRAKMAEAAKRRWAKVKAQTGAPELKTLAISRRSMTHYL